MNIATIADTEVLLADPLIAAALWNPPQSAPYLQAEVTALCELSKILADDPRVALRRFLEIAPRLSKAGFGRALEGSDAERAFTYLKGTRPPIVQDVIVPLFDGASQPLGTLWIAHHDSTSRFGSEDVRMMEQFASRLILALKLLEQAREHRHALALLESHQMALRSLTDALAEERRRRERSEAAESRARQALEFKGVVVREVHHRVKNTIQMAASLLSLHARATPSEQVRCSLQASYGRLRLLAKVHELLYASAGSTQEVLLPPLFQALGDALRQSFAEMSDRVQLRITSDPVELAADEAIPLALLANELITNAYKHAFPQRSTGEIVLNLSWTAEPVLVLHVADDGVGMRPDAVESGLGLQLIRAFAAQLHGTLVFAESVDAGGTAVTLTLPRGAKPRHEPERAS